MNGNGIELRTLPLAIGKQSPSKKTKSVKSRGREAGPKPDKSRKDDIIIAATGFVAGVKRKEAKRDINMNMSKKTEKKSGFRDWFMGKTAKSSKPKLTNVNRPDSMPVGPIVERLQKQTAYLNATMQQGGSGAKSPNNLSPDHEHFNYDEFVHRRHLFQNHSRPTFCDVCDDFILGLYKSAIKCKCK